MNRIVVACVGDAASLDTIQHLASTAEVVAVALDLDGRVALTAIRDAALAAGASRCHALDVRDEFARECLLPALHARRDDTAAAVGARASALVRRKLEEIAAFEQAPVFPPGAVASVGAARGIVPASTVVDVAFEDGIPVAVNGVRMALVELLESLEIITGESALAVLDRAIGRAEDQLIV